MLLMIERFHTHEKEKQAVLLLNIVIQNAFFLHQSKGFNLKLTECKDIEDSGSNMGNLSL